MRSNSIPRATASVARSAVIVSAALTRIVRVCRVRSRTDLSTRGHVQKLVLGRAAEIRPTNVKFIASGARLRGEEDGGALLVRGMGARRPSRDRVTPRGRRSRARVPPRRQRTRRPGERAAPGPVRTIERSGGRAHGGPGDARAGAATGFDGRAAGQRRRPRIRVQRRRRDGQGGSAVEPVPHRR